MSDPFNMEKLKRKYLARQAHRIMELERRQRDYVKALSITPYSRKDAIMDNNRLLNKKQLLEEKNDIKKKIWVAAGKAHRTRNHLGIQDIKCHIHCQERLSDENLNLKSIINNLSYQINNSNKLINELSKDLTAIQRRNQNRSTRLSPRVLEDQLETITKQECGYCAENEILQHKIVALLADRKLFNQNYMKLVQKLSSDKKYLVEIIEFAIGNFEQIIELYERQSTTKRHRNRELVQKKVEMQDLVGKTLLTDNFMSFDRIRSKQREVYDLQPKEFRRRAEVRLRYQRKIEQYTQILENILTYTRCHNVHTVIEKYQQQENLYYSYFNYANEISYHMTLLNNSVNRLYTDINGIKLINRSNFHHETEAINNLSMVLENKRKENEKLTEILNEHDRRIVTLYEALQNVRDISRCVVEPVQATFNDFDQITGRNIRDQLKALEKRINSVVAVVYFMERANPKIQTRDYVVKAIEKFCDWPTELDEIVLTQLCPECAERDDDLENCAILSIPEIKKKLYEKILQPEMQYCLHHITECRLPRARLLVARMNSSQ